MFIFLLPLCITPISSYRYLPETIEKLSYLNSRSKYASKISEIPHHVLVVYDNEYCSGSLIYSRIVLTVASCFVRNVEKCFVKVGANTVTSMGQVIRVLEKKIHEYYNRDVPLNNDIALLIIERDVKFGDNVKKTIIIEPEVTIRVGTTVLVAGWGGNNLPTKFIHRILFAEMKVISDEQCELKYGTLKTASKYCATYQPERRLSDNGGSAMYKDHDVDILVGVLSYGATYTEEDDCVALLTNISYFHRWIIVNSQRLLNKYCVDDTSYYSSYEYNDSMEIYDDYDTPQYI